MNIIKNSPSLVHTNEGGALDMDKAENEGKETQSRILANGIP